MIKLKLSDYLARATRKQAFDVYYSMDNEDLAYAFPRSFSKEEAKKKLCACALGAIYEEAVDIPDMPFNFSDVGLKIRKIFPELNDYITTREVYIKSGLSELEQCTLKNLLPFDVDELSIYNLITMLNDKLRLDFKRISLILKNIGY